MEVGCEGSDTDEALASVSMMQRVHLKAHGTEVELWPEHGGMISSLSAQIGRRRVPLLYTPADARPGTGKPTWHGCWAMLPFANRAFGAKLDTGFEVFDLPVNDPEADGNIHGFGWQNTWTVSALEGPRVVLSHELVSDGGPYRYRAWQTITLEPGGATLDLAIENRASRALPYGIGFHPWFPIDGRARFVAIASGEVALGPGFRPAGIVRGVRAAHDFSQGRPARENGERAVNFLGWDGVARLDLPDLDMSIRIEASPTLSCPVMWSPPNTPFLCFEPQSHGVGAPTEGLVRMAAGLQPLAPGGVLSGAMRLSVSELART